MRFGRRRASTFPSPETNVWGFTRSVNEMKFANGVADDLQENLSKIDDLGSEKTYNH